MAYCNAARKLLKVPLLKNIAYKPYAFVQLYCLTVCCRNAGTFLPAVLQTGQRKIRKGGGIYRSLIYNNSTFVPKAHNHLEKKQNAADIIPLKKDYIYGVFANELIIVK